MQSFIKDKKSGEFKTELLVDGEMFDKDTIFRAAYELVDKVYMFFKKKGDDYIVQFKLKDKDSDLESFVNSFGEELVYHDLRNQIEDKTEDIRLKYINTALGYSMGSGQIEEQLSSILRKIGYFEGKEETIEEKSVDDIIEDIKNDPDFADEQDDIISVLEELKEEEEEELKNKKKEELKEKEESIEEKSVDDIIEDIKNDPDFADEEDDDDVISILEEINDEEMKK